MDHDGAVVSDTVAFDVENYNDNQHSLIGTMTGSEGTYTID
jgi:hypothetical protein